MTMPKPILHSRRSGIGRLELNRPHVRNALDTKAWDALGVIVDRMAGDEALRCVIVSGKGGCFSAGTDVKEMAGATEASARTLARLENDVLCRLEDLPMPTIAAIDGFALGGGCELAMACDIRVASEDAIFGQPEVDMGWAPAAGATFRLPRLVGTAKAKEMIFTGRRVTASEALEMGLVNRVVAGRELGEAALGLAKEIAAKDPHVIRAAKHALAQNVDREQAIGREAEALAKLGTASAAQRNIQRFLRKK